MFHSTTILCVRRNGVTVMGGDGQVTMGDFIVKATASKIRTVANGRVIAGFAGSSADAFTLFERFEAKLQEYSSNLMRAAVELAKDWRTDKVLRKLEAMMLVADKDSIFSISGTGDVLEPDVPAAAIGSGGGYALAAAHALMRYSENEAKDIVRKSLEIAAEMCVYTNSNIRLEVIK